MMTTITAAGVSASLMALVVAVVIATVVLWKRPHYRSPIFTEQQIFRHEIYQLSAWIWPVTSLVLGAVVGKAWGASPILTSVAALAITLSLVVLPSLFRSFAERARYSHDQRLSKRIEQELEPLVIKRLQQIGQTAPRPTVVVRAVTTRNGVQGHVTVRLTGCVRSPRDLAREFAPIVPAYLKIRVECNGHT